MKEKLLQIIDYFAGKVVDIILAKVLAGEFDQLVADKVDAVVAEMTVVPDI